MKTFKKVVLAAIFITTLLTSAIPVSAKGGRIENEDRIPILREYLRLGILGKNLDKTNEMPTSTSKQEELAQIRLMAVGDNLIHSMVIKAGKQEDGTYNYDSMYENITEYVNQADVKIINQETVLINDPSKYSGYPTFGSPTAVGEAVINAGFNVVTQATNHAYDKREAGIMDSINFWKEHNIPVLGIHDTAEDAEDIYVYEQDGIRIAMLNYTYGLNGFVLPEGKDYLVDSLSDSEKIKSDIAKAKEISDFVVIFPHWGVEYTHKETDSQTETAQMLADYGADLIIGCHPHVVEPLKEITAADGRTVPCYYSLGNFISNQDEVPRMLGAIADVVLEKKNGEVSIVSTEMIPIVTHIESYSNGFKVYLLDDYNEDLAYNHRMRRLKGMTMSVDNLWNIWNSIE